MLARMVLCLFSTFCVFIVVETLFDFWYFFWCKVYIEGLRSHYFGNRLSCFRKKEKQETRFNLLFLLWASTSEVCWQSRYLITAVQPGLQVGGCCLSFCIGPETVLVYTKVPPATRVQRCAAIYVKLYNAPGQRKYTGIYHEWAQPACVRKSP